MAEGSTRYVRVTWPDLPYTTTVEAILERAQDECRQRNANPILIPETFAEAKAYLEANNILRCELRR